MIREAERFAKDKHKHQYRKDGKTKYWHHLAAVVANAKKLGIKDIDILCAAWLHDTIEDTNTDYDDLAERFGEPVARIVSSVTKEKRLPEKKREQRYMSQLRSASWKAQAVKLCDIWANIEDLKSGYKEYDKRLEQVEKKLRYFRSIKSGLATNRSKMPGIDDAIGEVNTLLRPYGKVVEV